MKSGNDTAPVENPPTSSIFQRLKAHWKAFLLALLTGLLMILFAGPAEAV